MVNKEFTHNVILPNADRIHEVLTVFLRTFEFRICSLDKSV